jgi:IS30 family transposase
VKKYEQLTLEERCTLAALRGQGLGVLEIAKELGRHRSTIYREVERNRAAHDGRYRAVRAQEHAVARRSRSRRNRRFGRREMRKVERLLKRRWSPEQVSGHLGRSGELSISHETIYRHVWEDWREGGTLHTHLRGARKKRRKRYGRPDSRGRLSGKRAIGERPASVEKRRRMGHWEIDTVLGSGKDCVVTLVERKSGYVLIGKLLARTVEQTSAGTLALMKRHPGRFQTVTSDHGTEFHGYEQIEAGSGVKFYFATPYHSWERGTNENTNGLIRQYLPKGASLAKLTQKECDAIAEKLNNRPRKRHEYKTPNQCFHHR